MAYKRAITRRKFGKRTNKTTKRYTKRGGGMTRRLGLGPIAPRVIAHLKYNTEVQASNVDYDWMFNLNSIYDPDRTGAGHQPYGHDSFQTLYNRYRVFAVSYVISATALTGNQNSICILPNNDSSAFTNHTLMSESPRALTKQVNGNGGPVYFKGRYNLRTITGQTSTQYKSDDRFQSQFGASPTEQIMLHLGNWGSLSGSPTSTTLFNITFVYHVEMFDPKPLIQS